MHVSEYLHVSKNHVLQFFLTTKNKNKQKKNSHTLVDIAKETASEKIPRKETLLELELLEVFVKLNNTPDFWKSLSKIVYITFHCKTSIIT